MAKRIQTNVDGEPSKKTKTILRSDLESMEQLIGCTSGGFLMPHPKCSGCGMYGHISTNLDCPMFDKEGLTPIAASARKEPDSEELLRARIRFILKTTSIVPTTFMLTSVIELIHLSLDEIIDIVQSEALKYGWKTEFSDGILGKVHLDSIKPI